MAAKAETLAEELVLVDYHQFTIMNTTGIRR